MSDHLDLIDRQILAQGQPVSLRGLIESLDRPQSLSDCSLIELSGLWGSLGRLVAAIIARHLNKNLIYVTAHIPDADMIQDDLETFCGHSVELFPAIETMQDQADATSDIACERLRLCQLLSDSYKQSPVEVTGHQSFSGQSTVFIATSIAALMQPVPKQSFLDKQSFTVEVGQQLEQGPDTLIDWLIDQEFQRVERVDVVGEFATRGGIVDFFPPGFIHPVRIEFFGDDVDSIRIFNLDSQRSEQNMESISINGCYRECQPEDTTCFLDLLGPQTLVFWEEALEITQVAELYLQRLEDPKGTFTPDAVFKRASEYVLFLNNRFSSGASDRLSGNEVDLSAQSLQRFENQGLQGLLELVEQAKETTIQLFCENTTQQKRLKEILTEQGIETIPEKLSMPLGYIQQGFSLANESIIFLSHHELFGQQTRRRKIRKIKSASTIDSFSDLEKGDLVVHVNHGIGRFQGMKTLTKDQRQEEFLAVEFAQKAIVHVPANKIELIHKYVGAGGVAKLSKLGSRSWEKQKQKVMEAVEDMAAELLEMQAHRNVMEGIRYPADTAWQKEFEELFAYQETEDQLTTAEEIKKDMQNTRPMDRLLCGDVGYGKTELALRAVFKAVEYGKQVAILVPTTVLAEQHFRTFKDRLANFPFSIDVLSRFRTAGESKKIIMNAKNGQVDILIGTHRILSDDVQFRDLGLVVIDEEQRFGVSHKERLKKMRKTVDVLTMTATPIPRTLHLALLGIRDISSLTTPPLDRRSIVTEVCSYDRKRIRQIILRELSREGQVYFVHNRVNNIKGIADTVQRLVPDARIVYAHGQMPKAELEEKMLKFVNQQADVLVSTTIIESGLDIPSANTMIVNDADRFGLAQLHQLRGRVGRYKNRAYAYMLLPEKRAINPIAVKRLKAIEEYSQLGSGFRIAMRDLEIRGAGNILGVEQSGHIDAVGYEMYCKLLSGAVKRKQKGREMGEGDSFEQTLEVPTITQLDIGIHNYIPRSYIASDRQRLEVYRRLAACSNLADIEQLEADLVDLFGKIPRSVDDLLQLTHIRILAAQWHIRSIVEHQPSLIFTMDRMDLVDSIFKGRNAPYKIQDHETVYVKLKPTYFDSPGTLLAFLRKILGKPPA